MERNREKVIPTGLVILFIAFAWFAIHSGKASAQQPTELVLTASAGFQGFYKDGHWLPVRVVLENSGALLEGEVVAQVADTGQESTPFTYPILLPPVSRKEITVYVFPTSYASTLRVSFVSAGDTKAEVRLALNRLNPSDNLIGVLAANPSAYNVFSLLDPINGTASVVELNIDDLPERVQGLAALDTLIFSGVDTGTLTEKQRSALTEWTAWGGRLIITGGPDWQETVFGLQTTGLLPLTPDNTLTLDNDSLQEALDQINHFSGDGQAIEPGTAGMLVSTGSLSSQAEVLANLPAINDLPLIIRQSYGSGQVVYITFDPSLPPFRNWNGAESFYRNLATSPISEPSWKNGFIDWSMAQQAAQSLPSLGLPSILLICGFLFIYVATIGPANYLLLRVLKRRELGWITIPILVVSFSILVFLTGSLSRGQKPVLHRLAIVQSWQGAAQARVDGVMGLYSPNRATYSVSASYPSILNAVPVISMFPTGAGKVTQNGDDFLMPGLRVDVGGVIPVAFQSSIQAPAFGASLALTINEKGTVLAGDVINQSQSELQDVILLTLTNVISLGDFTPGQTIPINQVLDIAQTGNPIFGPGGLKTAPGFTAPAIAYNPVNIIEQILGTYDYYQDRDTYRKYALLVAAMSSQPASLQQTNEVYLIGWSRQPLVEIGLENKKANTEDLSLYIIAFKPEVKFEGDRWTLSPGFFKWTSLDPLRTDVTPYNLYLYSATSYGLVFTPRQALDFTSVEVMTFHLLNPYQTGSVTSANFFLWDYELQDWEPLKGLVWGDNDIQSPARFAATHSGSDELGSYTPGTIRLRVESTSSYLEINTSDFSLVVER